MKKLYVNKIRSQRRAVTNLTISESCKKIGMIAAHILFFGALTFVAIAIMAQ